MFTANSERGRVEYCTVSSSKTLYLISFFVIEEKTEVDGRRLIRIDKPKYGGGAPCET